MGLILINKLLIFLVWLSIFNIVKELILFLVNLLVTEQPEPWKISDKRGLLLAFAVSYIMLSLFNGVTI